MNRPDERSTSGLDTKETFLHFSKTDRKKNIALKLFFKSLYKTRNLNLADALERSHFADNVEVNKVIRNLRFCNSVTVLKDDKGEIYRMNLTCKNKFCYLCCRAKSAKLSSRMMALLNDKFEDSNKYYFYFLTLTLQHDDKNRRDIYLKELKSLMNKLYRSKVFTEHFTTSNNKFGIVQAFENKISKRGNHIHSHNLIMCDKIKIRVNELEDLIRDKWKLISGGSYQIRLDLVKNRKDDTGVLSAVKELFKYSIKTDDSNNISRKVADRIGYWMIKTKGQNMINARGILRGHGITANKCKYDVRPERILDANSSYYLTKTAELKYNYSLNKKLKGDELGTIMNEVTLVDKGKALDITDVADDIEFAFQMGLTSDELFKHFEELKDNAALDCWHEPNGDLIYTDKITGEIKRKSSGLSFK